MVPDLSLTTTRYLAELAADGISPDEPITVWCVLADLLTLAGVPADDWPADVLASYDLVAPRPAA